MGIKRNVQGWFKSPDTLQFPQLVFPVCTLLLGYAVVRNITIKILLLTAYVKMYNKQQ